MDRLTLSILNAAGQLDDCHGFRRTSRINPRRVLGFVPAHAMAFKDDPDDPPADPPKDPPDGYVPQGEVDTIVQQRLAREQERERKRLEELGYSSWDELKQKEDERRRSAEEARRKAEEEERKRLEDRKEWDKLRELDRKKAEEREQELTQRLEQERTAREQIERRARESQINAALLSAATNEGALKPEQISKLLAGQLTHNEDGTIVVLDAQGKVRTNGSGQELTPQDFVKEFLAANTHFQRAAGGRGAGGGNNPPPRPTPGDLDLQRVRDGDIKYIRENKQAVYEARRKGLLK